MIPALAQFILSAAVIISAPALLTRSANTVAGKPCRQQAVVMIVAWFFFTYAAITKRLFYSALITGVDFEKWRRFGRRAK